MSACQPPSYDARMNRTFGPNALPLIAAVLGVAVTLAGLFALPYAPNLVMIVYPALFICLGCAMLAGSVFGWRWYRLDETGIRRFGLCESKFIAWDDIGGVPGRTVWNPKSGNSAIVSDVVDHEWRRVIRLGPWIRKRKELVRCIRQELAARNEQVVGGS